MGERDAVREKGTHTGRTRETDRRTDSQSGGRGQMERERNGQTDKALRGTERETVTCLSVFSQYVELVCCPDQTD